MTRTQDENLEKYIERWTADIKETIKTKNCQPVLFIGSGLSRRYAELPSWSELLDELINFCRDKYPLNYYVQEYGDLIDVGSQLGEKYRAWAWEHRENGFFPRELYEGQHSPDCYIKYTICQIIEEKVSKFNVDNIPPKYREEIECLKAILPHAIITTNYDNLLEKIFTDYTPVIGQDIIRSQEIIIGEIFKVHGCVTEYGSLVFNRKDYNDFAIRKRYLSAKLLTLFTEHPLLFVCYSASDPNIKRILSEIDLILGSSGSVTPNIYFLTRESELSSPASDDIHILLENNNYIRVKCIATNDFRWVFEAFSSETPLEAVSMKLLRALHRRVYHLVISDMPKKTMEVDVQYLEDALSTDEGIPRLLGFTQIGEFDPNSVNINEYYCYTFNQMKNELGLNQRQVLDLMQEIAITKGIDIKSKDQSEYHHATRGNNGKVNRRVYSKKYMEILKEMKHLAPKREL